ncbi:MAG: hypothetical protein ACFFB5_10035 [Promethearchaeota archaeon]
MKFHEKGVEKLEETDSYISNQISIIFNLKRKNILSDQPHIEPLSRIEENEMNMYIVKAQEIVTKWNEGLEND